MRKILTIVLVFMTKQSFGALVPSPDLVLTTLHGKKDKRRGISSEGFDMNYATHRHIRSLRQRSESAVSNGRRTFPWLADFDWCVSIGVFGALLVAISMTVAAFIASNFKAPPLVAHALQAGAVAYSVPEVKVLGVRDSDSAAEPSKLAQLGAERKQVRFIF
jgi:hypothetical protein